MKFLYNLLVLAIFAVFALAATTEQKPIKPYVVSYPKDTPDSVVEEAMEAVRKAGGKITHEYNLIKGFAAGITDEALNIIHTLGKEIHKPTIKEDTVVSINNN